MSYGKHQKKIFNNVQDEMRVNSSAETNARHIVDQIAENRNQKWKHCYSCFAECCNYVAYPNHLLTKLLYEYQRLSDRGL